MTKHSFAFCMAATVAVLALGFGPFGSPVASAAITDNLMGHWKLDDGSGTAVSDSTGNGFNGGLNVPDNGDGSNPTWTTGQIQGALQFNGGQRAYSPLSGTITPNLDLQSTPFTVSLWANPSLNDGRIQELLFHGQNSRVWANWGMAIGGQVDNGNNFASNKYVFYMSANPGETTKTVASIADAAVNQWNLVTAVYNNTPGSESLKLYVNGNLDATSNGACNMFTNGWYLQFGGDSGRGYYNGKMDDVGIWNRALSAQEIQGIYNTGLAGRDLASVTFGPIWTGGTSGDVWTATGNWNPNGNPGGVASEVTFGDASSAGHGTVHLDDNRTVGTINFKADVPSTIATSSGKVLTLDSTPGAALVMAAGTHTISTGVVLNSDAAFSVSGAGDRLTMSGAFAGNGKNITKSGDGTLDLAGNSLSLAGFTLSSGTVTGSGTITATSAYTLQQGTIDVVLAGNVGLNKSSSGTVTLNKANMFSGSTTINAGTLTLANASAIANSPSIKVAGGATLDASGIGGVALSAGRTLNGAGTVNGGLTATGATISADPGGVLSVTGSATLNAGTVLNLGIGNGTQQRLDATGSLALGGAVTVNVAPVGFVDAGTSYTIMQHGGITGAGSLNAPATFRGMTLDTTADPTKVQVTVGTAANLTWVGGAAGNKWNVNADANWNNTTSSINPDKFYHMDHVLFDDFGIANSTVTLVGNLAPRDVTVNVSTGKTYAFTGSGSLVGPTGITKSGAGTLTVATVNTFGGVDSSNNPLGIVSIHEGEIHVSPGAMLTNYTSEIDVGDTPGLTGKLTMDGATAIVPYGSSGYSGVNVGMNGGTGELTLTGNSLLDSTCTANPFMNVFAIGFNSVGTVTVGGTSTLKVVDGSILTVGEGGTGTLILRDQGVVQLDQFNVGSAFYGAGGGTGSLRLNGGTLRVPTIHNDGATTANIYFNGGTLQATVDTSNFITVSGTLNAYVQTGGAVIDSNGHNITISQSLPHDASGPATDGGLTKKGAGTLLLTGTNTYTGPTNINGGTLQLPAPSVARLKLWLDATDGSTLHLTAGKVTQWDDKSGAGNNAVPGSGTGPSLDATGLNGLPSLLFAGGTDRLISNFDLGHKDVTLAVVYRNLNPDQSGAIFGHDEGGGWHRLQLLANGNGPNNYGAGGYAVSVPAMSSTDPKTYVLVTSGGTGNGASIYLNGALAAGPFTDNNQAGNPWLNIGSISNDGGWAGNCEIAEIIGMYGVVSNAQRQSLEAYLNGKWFGGPATQFPSLGQDPSQAIPATNVNMSANTTLDLNDNIVTIGALNGSATAQVLLGPGTAGSPRLIVGGNGQSGSFAGTISGAGALVKGGAGVQIISGADGYTAGTLVKGGTLEIGSAGALPAGFPLTIDSSAAAGASAAAVPEPCTFALLAAALIATLATWLRRKM